MNKKLPTVTIGIPAYNEEANIRNILHDILGQNEIGFTIEKIIVLNDGSSDRTVELVQSINDKRIKVVDDGKRIGKPSRLNQLYRMINSDILVTFDADVLLDGKNVVSELVSAFKGKNIGLVGGSDIPMKSNKFFENIVSTASNIWYETRKNVNNGNTVFNHVGRISALAKQAYKKITIPEDMAADDVFLYFECKRLGFDFNFAPKARVLFKEPETLNDYLVQDSRYKSYRQLIVKHFGNSILPSFKTPVEPKIKALATYGFKKPLYTLLALVLKILVSHQVFKNNYIGSNWTLSRTTKIISPNFDAYARATRPTSKPTVSVGIPAFNEEENIASLLKSLLKQKGNFILKEVLVVNDGSTDNTVNQFNNVSRKNKIFKLLNDGKREGKPSRLNQIFSKSNSDILVVLDADIIIKAENYIDKLILPIINGADLTSTQIVPIKPNGYVEKTLFVSTLIKDKIKSDLNNGDNVLTCHGATRAFSKALYKTMQIPKIVSEDAYTYIYCKQNGFKYSFVPEVSAFYKLPDNLTDHKKQSVRYFQGIEGLKHYFDPKLVSSVYRLPYNLIIKSGLYYFIRYPTETMSYAFILILMKIRSYTDPIIGTKWQMATSTHKLK